MPDVASPVTAPPQPQRPKRWVRRILILCIFAVLLYLFHAPLLRGCAYLLISEDPAGPAEYVLPLSGGECWIEAVQQISAEDGKPKKIILLGDRECLAEQVGAHAF